MLSFDIDEAFPLVTIATMIGPSPDWFVGVQSLTLFDGGAWIPQISVDMIVYDAGTEDGVGFTLDNPASVPVTPIARSGLWPSPIGSFTFELQTAPEPGSMLLLGGALAALAFLRYRRR